MFTHRQLALFHQILVRHQSHELSGRVEKALHQMEVSSVGRALQRLEAGSYGKCLHCQRRLGYLMLVANPVLERCPDCMAGYSGLRPSTLP